MSLITSKIKNLFTGIKPTDSADLESCAGQYWQFSGWDERIQDQAHWCDVMRWPRERWIEYGDFYVAYVMRLLKHFAGMAFVNDLGRKTTLEWGCGGGANIRCLGKAFSHVYGVDISEETLNECGRQMEKCGLSNFSKVKFPAQSPERVLKKIPAESVDFYPVDCRFSTFSLKSVHSAGSACYGKIVEKGWSGVDPDSIL
jgi:SAM-dependent methyltransferase